MRYDHNMQAGMPNLVSWPHICVHFRHNEYMAVAKVPCTACSEMVQAGNRNMVPVAHHAMCTALAAELDCLALCMASE